ncbi:MAG TPA: hypothetical protein VFZ32_20470 [Micromonosporaceae bacterium]|jgi:hypothetical protein
MNMKKLMTWGGIAFLIFFVSQRPDAAGDGVQAIVEMVISVATGFADFAGNLVP